MKYLKWVAVGGLTFIIIDVMIAAAILFIAYLYATG